MERHALPAGIQRLLSAIKDGRFEVVGWSALGLALILPASWWGLPVATSSAAAHGWDVDSVTGLSVLAEWSNLTGTPQHDWYVAYPLFHYLLLGAVYAPYLLLEVLTGGLGAPSSVYPYGFTDPVAALRTLTLLGRAVTVLMGAASVGAVFVLARREFGRGAARVAAVVIALSAPFLFYSRTGNLDVPVLFWTLMAFLAIQHARTNGVTARAAVWCGVVAALAVATKDQAYGLLLPPLCLLALHRPAGGATAAHRRGVLLMGAAALVAFALASGLAWSPERFVRRVRYITQPGSTFANMRTPNLLTVLRPATPVGYAQLGLDVLQTLTTAIGWPAVGLGVAGLATCWRRSATIRWATAAGAGLFVLVILPIHHTQYRYVLGLSCILALGVAGLVDTLSRLGPRARVAGRLAALSAVLGVAPGGVEVTWAQLADARYDASRYLAEHAAPGDQVGYFGRPHQLPYLPAHVQPVSLAGGADARQSLGLVHPRWIIVAPDYFADSTRVRSYFLPGDVYRDLQEGLLGWNLVSRFVPIRALGRDVPYLPYVNPQVQVFERSNPAFRVSGPTRPGLGSVAP